MALPLFDLCRNSYFLTDELVAPVLNDLQELLDAVHESASGLGLPIAVLLGGSLARREPSVRFAGGRPRSLESDADMFVVVPDPALIPQASTIETATRNVSPQIDRSFHFVPMAASQRGHMGPSALSVFYGMDYPIFAPMTLPEPPNAVADPVDGLELLVHRLVTVAIDRHATTHLLTGGVEPLTPEGRRSGVLKLVLAGVEAQYYGKIDGAAGIHPALSFAEQGLFDGMIDRSTLSEFIRAREIFEPEVPLPKIDLGAFARAAVAKQFDCPVGLDLQTLIEEMSARRYGFEIPARRVALALTAYSLAAIGPDAAAEASIVRGWLERLPTSDYAEPVNSARDYLVSLLDRSPEEAFTSPAAHDAAGQLLFYVQSEVTKRAIGA